MPTPDEVGLRDEVLARIPLYPDQELRLRRRTLAEPAMIFLDWAQYNTSDGQYYLSTPFREDVEILDQMITALQTARDAL